MTRLRKPRGILTRRGGLATAAVLTLGLGGVGLLTLRKADQPPPPLFRWLDDPAVVQAADDAVTAHAAPAVPPGSNGESLVYTRSGTLFCLNAAGTSGVKLPGDVPCINGNGLTDDVRADNTLVWSEEFDDPVWVATNATVTPNSGSVPAPDGTLTADTVTSTAAGGYLAQETTDPPHLRFVGSLFVRSTAGTQAGALRLTVAGSGAVACAQTFTATEVWQRVKDCHAFSDTTTQFRLEIYPGGTAGTGSLLVWGAQGEDDVPWSTPYIPTTTGAMSREDPTAYFPTAPATWWNLWGAGASYSSDYTPASGVGWFRSFVRLYLAATGTNVFGFVDQVGIWRSQRGLAACGAVDQADAPGISWPAGVTRHVVVSVDGDDVTFSRDGVVDGTATHVNPCVTQFPTRLQLEGGTSFETLTGSVKNICVGTHPGSCT